MTFSPSLLQDYVDDFFSIIIRGLIESNHPSFAIANRKVRKAALCNPRAALGVILQPIKTDFHKPHYHEILLAPSSIATNNNHSEYCLVK